MNTLLIPLAPNTPLAKIKKFAAFFARPGKARLHFLKVVTSPEAFTIVDPLGLSFGPLYETTFHAEENDIHELTEQFSALGFEVEETVVSGFFDSEVIAQANKIKPDILLMFTNGSHSMIEDLFGTNTSHVFEKVDCPVMVIPNDFDTDSIKKVAVGIHIDDEKNFKVLNDLFELSDYMKLDLNFIKIDNNYQLDKMDDSAVLTHLQQAYPGRVSYVVHRKAQNLSKGLQEYADEINADMMVLFTTRKGFIEKLFHKGVTRDLVLHSKRPLLIYHF